ncbi:hypothetical protein CYMTET_46575 [Cymbomonas tetramitiformis]|uniref:Uncharacterized protein n=1 Tax=Cymbomonas tetramitiformis TaxID=36881 RepID=A0AAE0EYJ4_9CHLO|nr:hypothetical protein CYMTET_46575 [Cymbomonas tetramitiformis]
MRQQQSLPPARIPEKVQGSLPVTHIHRPAPLNQPRLLAWSQVDQALQAERLRADKSFAPSHDERWLQTLPANEPAPQDRLPPLPGQPRIQSPLTPRGHLWLSFKSWCNSGSWLPVEIKQKDGTVLFTVFFMCFLTVMLVYTMINEPGNKLVMQEPVTPFYPRTDRSLTAVAEQQFIFLRNQHIKVTPHGLVPVRCRVLNLLLLNCPLRTEAHGGRCGVANEETGVAAGATGARGQVGIDVAHGAQIVYLSDAGNPTSVLNRYDITRPITMSMYDGPENFDVEGRCGYNGTIWNPRASGDKFGNKPEILDWQRSDTRVNVLLRPLIWGCKNVPCDCTMEITIELETTAVWVTNKLRRGERDGERLLKDLVTGIGAATCYRAGASAKAGGKK